MTCTNRRRRPALILASYSFAAFAALFSCEEKPKGQSIDIDPGNLTYADTSGRQEVACSSFVPSARTAVILAFGQSNASNESDPNGLYVPGPGVFNFNFLDSKCYVARDPLLGATINRSSFVTRLGDLLVRRGVYDTVLLVPIAYGGTYMADWAPTGRLHNRLATALQRLQSTGTNVTLAIWQQGEAEGAQPNPDAAAYRENFLAMLSDLRTQKMTAPVYVAQSTVCFAQPNETIRQVQRTLVDRSLEIRSGPDTDVIGPDGRWDGCHFSVDGMNRAAELWFAALTR